MQIIRESFGGDIQRLDALDEASGNIANECTNILLNLFRYFPLLGFLLRSTNVRNAFEVFQPLRRIAEDVLEPGVVQDKRKTRLVLSSEWKYSPISYPEIPLLSDFVLIGLPAPESANPLLIPLAGHELGHTVWAKMRLETVFRPIIHDGVLEAIRKNWDEYVRVFQVPNIQPSLLESNMFAIQSWRMAVDWGIRQAEEVFCDCLGVRIFGSSYLYAFKYLLAPGVPGRRSTNYPKTLDRVEHLLAAARKYGTNISGALATEPRPSREAAYKRDFQNPALMSSKGDEFRLEMANLAIASAVARLIEEADNIISKTVSKYLEDLSEIARIYNRFKLVIPASNCTSLIDILSAAWKAYHDKELWSGMTEVYGKKDEVLRELVLKNIELFEYEHIVLTRP